MSEPDFEQLTLFPEDSPASHFPWLESRRVKGTTVTYGLRCCALSASCARIASSVRTYLESSRLPPGRWSRIWSAQDITSSCSILKLRLSERGTGERECSLWPTPTALDPAKEKMKSTQQKGESRHSLDLPQAVKLWPTPIAGQCGMKAKTSGREPGKSTHLGMQVLIRSGLYPTPRANEGKDRLQHVPPSRMKDHGKCNLTQAIAMERLLTTPCAADATGTTGGANHRSLRTDVAGQLNPAWVEWLMGFPIGWTDLNAPETR